jgi:hypothetical protein
MQIKIQEPRLVKQFRAMKYQLRKFKKMLPEGSTAYIAGGSLRDLHHGWGCRDVDIFYNIPENKIAMHYDPTVGEQVYSHLSHFSNLKILGRGENGYDYDEHQGIQDIYEHKIHKGDLKYNPLQLIRVKSHPLSVIADFPINMSRIWMGTDGIIHTCESYDYGYENSIMREMHRKQYNYLYLAKILGRYSDYAFYPLTYFSNQKELQKKMIKEANSDNVYELNI